MDWLQTIGHAVNLFGVPLLVLFALYRLALLSGRFISPHITKSFVLLQDWFAAQIDLTAELRDGMKEVSAMQSSIAATLGKHVEFMGKRKCVLEEDLDKLSAETRDMLGGENKG